MSLHFLFQRYCNILQKYVFSVILVYARIIYFTCWQVHFPLASFSEVVQFVQLTLHLFLLTEECIFDVEVLKNIFIIAVIFFVLTVWHGFNSLVLIGVWSQGECSNHTNIDYRKCISDTYLFIHAYPFSLILYQQK